MTALRSGNAVLRGPVGVLARASTPRPNLTITGSGTLTVS